MDIVSLQSNIQYAREFTFGNKTILFSKVTSYDNKISVDIDPLYYSNNYTPYAYKMDFYFNIYSGSDVSKISITRQLVPSNHKNKIIQKKFLWLIPYKSKTWDSEFWKQLSELLICTKVSYYSYVEKITKENPNLSYKSYKEWFIEESETTNYYNYIKNIYDEFTNKFNEWKKENA